MEKTDLFQIELISLLAELVLCVRTEIKRSQIERIKSFFSRNKEFKHGHNYLDELRQLLEKHYYNINRQLHQHFKNHQEIALTLSISLLSRERVNFEVERFIFSAHEHESIGESVQQGVYDLIIYLLKVTIMNCDLWDCYYGKDKDKNRLKQYQLDFKATVGSQRPAERALFVQTQLDKQFPGRLLSITVLSRELPNVPEQRTRRKSQNTRNEEIEDMIEDSQSETSKRRKVSVYSYFDAEEEITFISSADDCEESEVFEVEDLGSIEFEMVEIEGHAGDLLRAAHNALDCMRRL